MGTLAFLSTFLIAFSALAGDPVGFATQCTGNCIAKHARLRSKPITVPKSAHPDSDPLYLPLLSTFHFYDSYEHQLDTNVPVYKNDLVITGPGSVLKILLNDDTVLRISPNTVVHIDTAEKVILYCGRVGVIRDPKEESANQAFVLATTTDEVRSTGRQEFSLRKNPSGKIEVRSETGTVMVASLENLPKHHRAMKVNPTQALYGQNGQYTLQARGIVFTEKSNSIADANVPAEDYVKSNSGRTLLGSGLDSTSETDHQESISRSIATISPQDSQDSNEPKEAQKKVPADIQYISPEMQKEIALQYDKTRVVPQQLQKQIQTKIQSDLNR